MTFISSLGGSKAKREEDALSRSPVLPIPYCQKKGKEELRYVRHLATHQEYKLSEKERTMAHGKDSIDPLTDVFVEERRKDSIQKRVQNENEQEKEEKERGERRMDGREREIALPYREKKEIDRLAET